MSQQPYSLRTRLAFFRRMLEFFQGSDFASLLDLVQRIDAEQISQIFDALRQLMQATEWTGPEGRVAAGIRIARVVAEFSETETDDQLIATLESILQNVGVLNVIAAQCEAAASLRPVAMTANDQAVYEAAGIDLGRIIAIINLLLELFRGTE